MVCSLVVLLQYLEQSPMNRSFPSIPAALLLVVSLIGFGLQTQAQLEVETGLTLEEYVNDILLGSGIQASNITYQGGTNQLGYLTGGDDVFSISSGLVLSCDVAENLECPTDFLTCDGCLGTGFSDPDLLDIANSVPGMIGESFSVNSVNDGCVLEFDFVAAGIPSASTTSSVQMNMKRGSTLSTTTYSLSS